MHAARFVIAMCTTDAAMMRHPNSISGLWEMAITVQEGGQPAWDEKAAKHFAGWIVRGPLRCLAANAACPKSV
jgi:hypothetical protein